MRRFRFELLTCLWRHCCGWLNATGEKSLQQRFDPPRLNNLTKALPVLVLIYLALPASAQREIVTVTNWRVNTGDNAAWARPDFDDSQ